MSWGGGCNIQIFTDSMGWANEEHPQTFQGSQGWMNSYDYTKTGSLGLPVHEMICVMKFISLRIQP